MSKILESFGRRSIWLAIKETSPEKIKLVLQLKENRLVDWSTGLHYARQINSYIMITQPYEKWNFVFGLSLPELSYHKCTLNWLKDISNELGEIYYFESYRTVGLAGWAIAKAGILERAYCYLGEQGTIFYNYGDITKTEKKLELHFAGRDEELFQDGYTECDEDTILMLANEWTISPQLLEGKLASKVICGKLDLQKIESQYGIFVNK